MWVSNLLDTILFICVIFLLIRLAYLKSKIESLDKAAHKTVDVIKTLSEALETINDGYKDHEKRILGLEKVEDVSKIDGRYAFHLDGATRMVTKNALREILGMIPIEKQEKKRICRDCASFDSDRFYVDNRSYGYCSSKHTCYFEMDGDHEACPCFKEK